jgi:hypothetical protein
MQIQLEYRAKVIASLEAHRNDYNPINTLICVFKPFS